VTGCGRAANSQGESPRACPILSHRSRAGAGSIFDGIGTDDPLLDGYYLGQRTLDASRKPFWIDSGRGLPAPPPPPPAGVSVYGVTNAGGSWDCYVLAGGDGNLDAARTSTGYRGKCTPSGYSQGSQQGGGPLTVLLEFTVGQVTFNADARVVVTFTDGTQVTAWLPPGSQYAWAPASVSFWVAEDGSTYWGHDGTHYIGKPASVRSCWNVDAYYATRWYAGNLARSAYDGRVAAYGSGSAKSPAVDAGSRDFLNGGSTKTDLRSQNEGHP
jgi:hypothetical protein